MKPWTPHQAVGLAIHAGVAEYLSQFPTQTGISGLDANSLQRAREMLRAHYVQQETWGLAGLEALVTKGLTVLATALTHDLLPGATVIGVEKVIEGGGHHRVPDLILARGEMLEVWDWKTKLRLDDRYLPETQQAVLHDWQLLDYAVWSQQTYRRPVVTVGHGLVILGPRMRVEFIKVPVTPARLDQARQEMQTIWFHMAWAEEDAAEVQWHNWAVCTDKHLHYGQVCPFFEACHLYNGDEQQFPALYRPVEPHDHAL